MGNVRAIRQGVIVLAYASRYFQSTENFNFVFILFFEQGDMVEIADKRTVVVHVQMRTAPVTFALSRQAYAVVMIGKSERLHACKNRTLDNLFGVVFAVERIVRVYV